MSLLRLGVDLELFPSEDRALVDELFIVTEPAHIQRRSEGKKTAEERDVLRADLLRERLVEVPRPSDNKLDGTESESDEA